MGGMGQVLIGFGFACSWLRKWHEFLRGPFTFLYQKYARKDNDAKNPGILEVFNIERIQLNSAHVQSLEKLRPIAFAETCRFLTFQALEFQEIWQKNRMIYHEKSEF